MCRLGQGFRRGELLCVIKEKHYNAGERGGAWERGERNQDQQGGTLQGWIRVSWEPSGAEQHKRDFERKGINQRGFLSCLPWCMPWASLPQVTPTLSFKKAALLTNSFIWKWIFREMLKGTGMSCMSVLMQGKNRLCGEAGAKDFSVNPWKWTKNYRRTSEFQKLWNWWDSSWDLPGVKKDPVNI